MINKRLQWCPKSVFPGCDISSFMPILVNNCLRERPVDDLFKEEEAEIELLDATVSKLE